MYTVDGNDKVVFLEEVPQSSVGAPVPILFGDEHTTIVAYILADAVSAHYDDNAFVKFSGCRAHMFGPPNDEAFAGHPLTNRGLEPYSAYRIENSSWMRQLVRMNSVRRNHNPDMYQGYTHYVLSFHDSTFECIALSLSVSVVAGPLHSLLDEFERLWRQSEA